MTKEQIFNMLVNVKKGRYVALQKKKVINDKLVKVSDLVIRLGVNFANMAVNEGRETGSLPWGHWVEGYEGLVLEHKGKYYLRVASSYAENNRSAFYLNGEEISREEAIVLVGEKKLGSKPADVYNINFDNIIALDVH